MLETSVFPICVTQAMHWADLFALQPAVAVPDCRRLMRPRQMTIVPALPVQASKEPDILSADLHIQGYRSVQAQ